ncbi:MAG TPA: hypothetical protein VN512_06770 [Clostridia bacterium]|nr:hypothetical protein [Clostridia bacterium]
MEIKAVDEYNGKGHLIYAENFVGAYVRGKTREEALQKFTSEIRRYLRWLGAEAFHTDCSVAIVQEKRSELQVHDADSDVLFTSEIPPLTQKEYEALKALALKSAKDFLTLYRSVPDKAGSSLTPRDTFYGRVPITAREMYEHTKNVNGYYFREIEVEAENEPDIYSCRAKAFETLETQPDFLSNTVYNGSYGEQWSLRKVCRRFVWHDRIHAKAMYRMTAALCGPEAVCDLFFFS